MVGLPEYAQCPLKCNASKIQSPRWPEIRTLIGPSDKGRGNSDGLSALLARARVAGLGGGRRGWNLFPGAFPAQPNCAFWPDSNRDLRSPWPIGTASARPPCCMSRRVESVMERHATAWKQCHGVAWRGGRTRMHYRNQHRGRTCFRDGLPAPMPAMSRRRLTAGCWRTVVRPSAHGPDDAAHPDFRPQLNSNEAFPITTVSLQPTASIRNPGTEK